MTRRTTSCHPWTTQLSASRWAQTSVPARWGSPGPTSLRALILVPTRACHCESRSGVPSDLSASLLCVPGKSCASRAPPPQDCPGAPSNPGIFGSADWHFPATWHGPVRGCWKSWVLGTPRPSPGELPGRQGEPGPYSRHRGRERASRQGWGGPTGACPTFRPRRRWWGGGGVRGGCGLRWPSSAALKLCLSSCAGGHDGPRDPAAHLRHQAGDRQV